MRISEASAAALEWPAFCRLLGALAETELGRRRAEQLRPTADAEALAARRQATEEASRLLADGALVPPLGEGVEALVPRLRSGHPPLAGAEILQLAAVLRAGVAVRDRIAAADPPLSALAALAAPLSDPQPLIRRIERTLDRRGAVRDDASPQLVALRGRIQRARDELYGELGAVSARHRELLTEETVPLRGGRLMLMLNAGARGRIAGLVHGRSASGQSYYFEPLEVVEANNTLQGAVEEDEAERQRLFAALLADLVAEAAALERWVALLGLLDYLQAVERYARLAGARLAEVASPGVLRLVAARHPLLDPRLAELRERALGSAGHRGELVPLDLELGGERRVLVVTGPNAGGKTVALKCAGLLVVAAQSGLPVPAAAGSALPCCEALVAVVGDEQDLLADRSTFSGRLLRLGEVWEARSPASLLLVDELGSGTDPEEGAALAVALLEGLVATRGLAVVTTHLVRLAAAALEQPGAGCAAMEFEPESGRPTYRLLSGPPGGSEALALARRLGLPRAWLTRAEALLSPAQRDLRRLLAEVERSRQELATALRRAQEEELAAAAARTRLEAEQQRLATERRELASGLARDLESFRRTTRARLAEEVERLRSEWEAGRRRELAERATARLFEGAPRLEIPAAPAAGAVREGERVVHRSLGWSGRLERLTDGTAEVSVGGKRLRCDAADLAPAGGTAASRPRRVEVSEPPRPDCPRQLDLIGERVEPALTAVDEYLDRAARAGLSEVRLIHGHGTGRLRQALREHLRGHPLAVSWRPGDESEGGNGATMVSLGR
ncbi:MAG TPA: Smr/MutS family protein [Thermoanaerobaculia bacterium]|nr:Smr/MutS family protein [Thermoanaerobaculia bacterium]